ncbi:MAG: hypothetical protein ABIR33_10490 [Pyrinomonadaceae bacterium]
MQRPQESLDDFLNSIEPRPETAPSKVSLRPTGEVEVLSPLPLDQAPSVTSSRLLLQHGAPRISWFHRSLIFGGAAAAAVMIVFLSAVFIAMSERSDMASVDGVDTPSYPSNAPIDISLPPVDETAATDDSTSAIGSKILGELRTIRRVVKSHRIITEVQRVDYRPRRTRLPAQVPFVPTTLVIYVENGEIKNRIEPAFSAAYKLPASFAN